MTRKGRPRRLLFVCTANQHRSRTAEELYRDRPGVEVRSAGTDVHPDEPDETPLTEALLRWADLVFVMEPYHRDVIDARFPGHGKPIVVLGIPDRYLRGDPALVRLLRERIEPHL